MDFDKMLRNSSYDGPDLLVGLEVRKDDEQHLSTHGYVFYREKWQEEAHELASALEEISVVIVYLGFGIMMAQVQAHEIEIWCDNQVEGFQAINILADIAREQGFDGSGSPKAKFLALLPLEMAFR